jgi:predicted MPP superfamily phosphohydrolase
MRRPRVVLLAVWLAGGLLAARPATLLPNTPDSLKMAVIGDNGSGDRLQMELAGQMALLHQQFPYELVVMVGDNFYGSQKPADLEKKFAVPYKPLLDAGVTFQAALGNHDDVSANINYAPLNMRGQRYYTYVRKGVRFIVLDSNELDAPQLRWAESTLQQAAEDWKIAYFHHPLYGNAGRHGSNVDIRVLLEPMLLKYGVQVVFSGHDHIYERLKPQKGIHYFVTGSGGKLRKGDLQRSETTAAGFDQDVAFLLAEIVGDELHFQVVSRTGATVDSGQIRRQTPRSGT